MPRVKRGVIARAAHKKVLHALLLPKKRARPSPMRWLRLKP